MHWSLLLIVLLLAAASGCTSQRRAPGPQPDRTGVPDDLRITFGREGGFAGRLAGHTIRADGSVAAWEGRAVGQQERVIATLAPDSLSVLWGAVQEVRFFEHDRQEVGDMTAFVNVTAAGRSHRVAWVVRPGESPEGDEMRALYATLARAVRAAAP